MTERQKGTRNEMHHVRKIYLRVSKYKSCYDSVRLREVNILILNLTPSFCESVFLPFIILGTDRPGPTAIDLMFSLDNCALGMILGNLECISIILYLQDYRQAI